MLPPNDSLLPANEKKDGRKATEKRAGTTENRGGATSEAAAMEQKRRHTFSADG
ncbi:hypothetical protein [Alloprevotella tannerae]|uniref:Uncharacterized protein n=1 Tax=Alloprevotella tannerae ATCC 51259 TaxID=626522 RepID=C9LGL4_9BACT|nr:hypothetical protein [Alloprevotella tannerae]EEX71821.1 hypothetical protein GCWU000325_01357 [Alloprevotella tannerae ATCC 51259]